MMKQKYFVKCLFIPKKRLERIEKKKKVKKEIEDEIETLGQTPMHPRKRLEMTNKIKNIKKEQKEEDEGEVTMEVNNQNKLKQADKILKDNIKKKLKFQKIIFIIQKKE